MTYWDVLFYLALHPFFWIKKFLLLIQRITENSLMMNLKICFCTVILRFPIKEMSGNILHNANRHLKTYDHWGPTSIPNTVIMMHDEDCSSCNLIMQTLYYKYVLKNFIASDSKLWPVQYGQAITSFRTLYVFLIFASQVSDSLFSFRISDTAFSFFFFIITDC